MLRNDPRQKVSTVSDTELGVAAMLLLVTVVLTALLVPAIA